MSVNRVHQKWIARSQNDASDPSPQGGLARDVIRLPSAIGGLCFANPPYRSLFASSGQVAGMAWISRARHLFFAVQDTERCPSGRAPAPANNLRQQPRKPDPVREARGS